MLNREKYLSEALIYGPCGIAKIRLGKKASENDECPMTGKMWINCNLCKKDSLEWLNQEYETSTVDWPKIPRDTLIEVSRYEDFRFPHRAYFAYYDAGMVWVWAHGATSKTCYNTCESWKYARLIEGDEE